MEWLMQCAGGVGVVVVLVALTPIVLAATEPRGCSLAGTGDGVVGVEVDRVLGRSWELRQQCGHPEQPLRAVPMAANAGFASGAMAVRTASTAAVNQPPLVLAGSVVRVTERGTNLMLEVYGTAEGSGRAGERVVVRLDRTLWGGEGDEAPRRVTGVVKMAGVVEIP
jgi:hypothetical protein